MGGKSMKKAYVFIANGFEEVEAITPIDYLRRANIETVVVGVGTRQVKSPRNVTIICDTELNEVLEKTDETLLVVLPGGLDNSKSLGESEAVENFVKAVHKNGGIIAAICAAPVLTLGKWGMLDGKKFTCYPGMGEDLATKPLQGERVVRDGNIITGCGAGAAEEFSFALIEAVSGKTALQELKKSIVAR
ncbi:DJ-1/PfpI family protein [Treponema phagedenis]|uniref:DJ-1/PfpI family protein n=2 Tax=Treponema phagedenis TaxID=162 RepID=A0AAE6IWM4_TREPH|nr:DJ-1/PfpI family protein [Treponema phagedenis]QEJ99544.1 DJ-1/PfpI family protein [Treponema phagedenis]QEJ99552.1 DJ-1/PfpI family protein [Treponema phagedenis]QEJ99561.1 DJ-1/PfpI family protein [Treponema phagedenis]QEK02324.1 DJ-1/PfpI family protein [Treponema phagedenis]